MLYEVITSDNPVYQRGLEITANSDCFTCHKIDEKNIGPAWRDVANKYAGQDTAVEYLAHKIINGGSGVITSYSIHYTKLYDSFFIKK